MALVGLRASYHRILGRIELLLPAKLRPVYNHPAGNPKTVRAARDFMSYRIVYLFNDQSNRFGVTANLL